MYEKRLPTKAPNGHPQFYIRRSEIEFDPKVKYVEHVCAILLESRFGPGRTTPLYTCLSDQPELEPAVFYDPCEGDPRGLVPCYAISPLGRAGFQVVEAEFRRAKQMGLVDAAHSEHNSPSDLTPYQGPGSP